jgi:hypothetical protein
MPPEWVKRYYEGWLFPEARDKPLTDRMQTATVVGHFCEQYVKHLLGGVRDDTVVGEGETSPDLVYWNADTGLERDIIVEVKGLSRKYGLPVSNFQVANYDELSREMFPLTQPDCYYAIVVYEAEKLTKTCQTENQALEMLGASITGTLLLPLVVMKDLIRWLPNIPSRYWHTSRGKDGNDSLTRLSGRQLSDLISNGRRVPDWLREKFEKSRREVTLLDEDAIVSYCHSSVWKTIRWRTPCFYLYDYWVRPAWLTMFLPWGE